MLTASVTIRDGQSQLLVAENLLLTDDADTLNEVTVVLTNPQVPAEEISVSAAEGITLTASSTTLRLVGPAPVSAFTDTLRTLTYRYMAMSSLILQQPNTATRYTHTWFTFHHVTVTFQDYHHTG